MRGATLMELQRQILRLCSVTEEGHMHISSISPNTQRTKGLLFSLQVLITVTGITGVGGSFASATTLSLRLGVVTAVVAGRWRGTATPGAPSVLPFLLAIAAFVPAASGRILGLVVIAVVVAAEDLLLVSHLPGPLFAAFAGTATGLPPPFPSGFVVLVLLCALFPLFVFPLRFTAGVLCLTATSFLFFIT